MTTLLLVLGLVEWLQDKVMDVPTKDGEMRSLVVKPYAVVTSATLKGRDLTVKFAGSVGLRRGELCVVACFFDGDGPGKPSRIAVANLGSVPYPGKPAAKLGQARLYCLDGFKSVADLAMTTRGNSLNLTLPTAVGLGPPVRVFVYWLSEAVLKTNTAVGPSQCLASTVTFKKETGMSMFRVWPD